MTHSSERAGRSGCLGTLPNAVLWSECASGGRCSVSSWTPSSPHYLLKFLMSLSLWAHSLPPLRPHLPSPLSDFSFLLHHTCSIPPEQYMPPQSRSFPSLSTTSLQSVTIFSLFRGLPPPSVISSLFSFFSFQTVLFPFHTFPCSGLSPPLSPLSPQPVTNAIHSPHVTLVLVFIFFTFCFTLACSFFTFKIH